MTDQEIIKALECCKGGFCCECPRLSNGRLTGACMRELITDALDLINRYEAENERLSSSAKQWEDTAKDLLIGKEKQQAEIERLQIRLRKERHQFADLGKMYSEIRTEAIKEFARALRQQAFDRLYVSINEVDNLVKEMVGEDK